MRKPIVIRFGPVVAVRITRSDGTLRSLDEIEGDILRVALERCPKRSELARILNIGRSTLYRKLEKLE